MELVEPAGAPTPNPDLPVRQHVDGHAKRNIPRLAARYNTVLTIATASLAPILYLVFIDHYAVNSLHDDDWSVVPLVHAALHGQLSLSQLWQQYYESRLVFGNLIEIIFGFTNQLDERAILFFGAAVFIASYLCLLALVRNYLSTRLTPLSVLVVGVVWFSAADVANALYAFQVTWYLTVFFFVAMLWTLLVPQRRRHLWLVAAVLLAVAASLSTVQGFICWPLGAICILWPSWSRRGRTEITIWLAATVATTAAYLPGYRFNQGNTCYDPTLCTTSYELHHPLTALAFFFALIGNVIPGATETTVAPTVAEPARFVVVGVVLFAASIFILVQSWRHRASAERLPLPALLIAFGLLFDLTISIGRSGAGVAAAVSFNRYVMANLIVLTGLVIYALARVTNASLHRAMARSWRVSGTYLVFVALAVFVVIQVSESTRFGLTNGASTSTGRINEARYFVNDKLSCQKFETLLLQEPTATLRDAAEDHLGEFEATSYRYYRELGAPPFLVEAAKENKHVGCFLPPIGKHSR
jgi:hypothetical protein